MQFLRMGESGLQPRIVLYAGLQILMIASAAFPAEPGTDDEPIGCSVASGSRPIALADAIEAALGNQPQVLIAQESIAKARANLMAARTPFMPAVTLSFQSERFVPATETQPVTVGNIVVGGKSATKTSYGSIGLSWNLYSGGRDAAGYRASRSDVQASEAAFTNQLNDTLSAVLTTYSDLYEAQLEAKVQAQVLSLQQDVERRTEQQFKQGTTTTLAIAQSQTSVLETSRTLYEACRAVVEKSAILAETVGLHLGFDELFQLNGPLPEPSRKAIADIDWQNTVQNDPAVIEVKKNVETAEFRLTQAKASYGPKLILEGRKDYLGQDQESWRAANHIEPNSYRVGLQIQQPILPMTSEYSAVKSAQSDLRRAEAEYQRALLATESKLHFALSANYKADKSRAAAARNLREAEELLSLTQSLYISGRVDQNRVNEARIAVDKAGSAVDQAISQQRLAQWLLSRVSDPHAFLDRTVKQLNIAMPGQF